MTWLTWRQFRTPALSVLGALALAAVLLAATGPQLAVLLRSSGDDFFVRLSDDHLRTAIFLVGTGLVYVLPGVVGAFWGAPLVARELEAGTHRLVWSQSVGRQRWLATKLGITGVAALVAGLMGLALTWWCGPIDDAVLAGQDNGSLMAVPRITPVLFGSRGVVPLAMTVLALAIGVAAGLLVRRTVPAMAATLVAVVGLQIAMPLVVQAHLVEPEARNVKITAENFAGLRATGEMDAITLQQFEISVDEPGAWVTSNKTVDSSGDVTDALPSWARCAPGSAAGPEAVDACFDRLADAGFSQRVEYFPAARFWAMQGIEAALLLGLAGLLVGVSFWRIRRDLT